MAPHPLGSALVCAGPLLAPGDTERDAPAVEVLLYWGDELLRAVHLDPPRALFLGDRPGDLGVPAGAGDRAPLVVVDAQGVRVMTPAGATGALFAGGGARVEPLGEGKEVGLADGARLRLTLPSRAGSVAYRANGAPALGADAPLVLEIARVRAGRKVGRGSLEMTRLLACCAIAAASALAVLANEKRLDDLSEEDDLATRDQMLELQRALGAIAERDLTDEVDPPDPDHPCRYHEGVRTCVDPHVANGLRRHVILAPDPPLGLGDLCTEPADARNASEMFAPPCPWTVWSRPWPSTLRRPYESPWEAEPWADSPLPIPMVPGRVHVGTPVVWGALPAALVLRALRGSHGRLRACYARGLAVNPALHGSLELRFQVGSDGHAADVRLAGSDVTDAGVVACVVRAVQGISVPAPTLGAARVMLPVQLVRADARDGKGARELR
jgi:hypothetical protein